MKTYGFCKQYSKKDKEYYYFLFRKAKETNPFLSVVEFTNAMGLTETKFISNSLRKALRCYSQLYLLLRRGVRTPSKTLELLLDCIEKQLKENEKGKKHD